MKGGKSKYYLNGSNATNEKIKGLFQSVQLNVNNPHFLIMQGKVTQVVKMKPKELLSLLEETAGTSLYEGKKKTVQATIEKKDKKLEEIEMLSGPIQEKIEKHKAEKEMLAKYKGNEAELGKVRRILVAHEYFRLSQAVARAEQEKMQLRTQYDQLQSDSRDLVGQQQAILSEQAKYRGPQSDDLRARIGSQKERCAGLQRDANSLGAEMNAREREIVQECEDEKTRLGEIAELKRAQERRTKERDELRADMAKRDSEIRQSEKYVKELEAQLQSLSSHGNEANALRPLQQRAEQLEASIEGWVREVDVKSGRCDMLRQQKVELEGVIKRARRSIANTKGVKERLMLELAETAKELEGIEAAGDEGAQRVIIEQQELQKKVEGIQHAYNELQGRYHLDAEVPL